jgi:hypothetical protein
MNSLASTALYLKNINRFPCGPLSAWIRLIAEVTCPRPATATTLPQKSMFRLLIVAMLALCAWLAPSARGQAGSLGSATAEPQSVLPPGTPTSWVQAAVRSELAIMQDEAHPMRYLIRIVNRKGDMTREVIESAQGNVARLIQRDGKPITAAEDTDERKRLNDVLSSPSDFLKHQERNGAGISYATQLIKLLPQAGIYTYVPGQPQPPGFTSQQVVIDFRPNPEFHPPSMIAELLTGLKGRVWIDARTATMTRIEGDIIRPVNFGWGVVARIYPGGHVEFEQTQVGGKRWIYSHLDMNITVREIMFHTVNDKTKMSTWNHQLLTAPISYQDASHELLAEKIPLQ